MHYTEFKAAIQQHLKRKREGATWVELREALALPYERACPEWTRRLEEEIGLVRRKGAGRALVWRILKVVLITHIMAWDIPVRGQEPDKNAVYEPGLASLTFAYPASYRMDPRSHKDQRKWWAHMDSPKGELSIEAMSHGYCDERLHAVEGYKSPEDYVLKEICGPDPARRKFEGYDRLISRTRSSVTVVFLRHGSEWGKCYQQLEFRFADGAYPSLSATIEKVIDSARPSFDARRWP